MKPSRIHPSLLSWDAYTLWQEEVRSLRRGVGSSGKTEGGTLLHLLSSINPSKREDAQLWAMAFLLIECGLAPSQICSLKVKDLDDSGVLLDIPATWGRDGRLLIRLPVKTAFWLRRWLDVREGRGCSYIFLESLPRWKEHEDRPLSTRTISRRMNRVADLVGYKKSDAGLNWSGLLSSLAPLVVQDATSKKDQFVYFFEDVERGAIKVGVSCNPSKRRREVEIARGRPIKILGILRGGLSLERKIHAELAEDRLDGEWFRSSGKVLRWVEISRKEGGQQLGLFGEGA